MKTIADYQPHSLIQHTIELLAKDPGLVPWHRDVRGVLVFQVSIDMCDQGIYPELAEVKVWVAERLDAS